MIEVNLLPAAGKGKKGGGARRNLAMPSFQRLPGDRWVVGAGGLVLVGLIAIAWLFVGVAGKAEEVQVQIEAAQRDSARFADVIRRAETLQARRDTIAQRVAALQQIDGARFVWPHLMDEVGRALPQGTWLTRFNQLAPAPNLSFRIEGNAISYFALTNFMETLEGSPFVTGVRLVASDQRFIQIPGAGQQRVYNFVLDADYQEPPPEVIDREPLFGASVAIPFSEDDAGSADTDGEGS